MLSNYEKFVTDYNNTNLTGHDVRRINGLNGREYCKLRNLAISKGDIPRVRHMNRTNAKFYSPTSRGTWTVQKQYGNNKLFVGEFPDEETAKMVRDKCLEVEWSLNKIRDVIDENKIKPKNYSIVNGYYVVQKVVDGKNRVFCTFNTDKVEESFVEKVVDLFRENDWDINCKEEILNELVKYEKGQ